MQALFEFVAGLLAALASLAFAQFGVAVHGAPPHHAQQPEVHRTYHPGDQRTAVLVNKSKQCPQATHHA